MSSDSSHKARTLTLVSVLHAFTHVYQVALMPLYLPIQKSFHLDSVGSATFLVTLMMLSYFLPSYVMGVMADRFSRKKLLGLGLAVNGLGFIGLALAPSYPLALASVVVAGFGGSFFHPAATALIARLYPVNTGRALGLVRAFLSAPFTPAGEPHNPAIGVRPCWSLGFSESSVRSCFSGCLTIRRR